MQVKIDEYFNKMEAHTKEVMSASGAIKLIADPLTPTIQSLCVYLGLQMQTLSDYGAKEGYEDFFETVAFAKARILGEKTVALVNGKGSTNGLMFDLVNNNGWKNKTEVETDNKNEHIIRVTYE